MPKYVAELPDYEEIFPESKENPTKTTPQRSQHIKATGTPARLRSLIRSAEEHQVQFQIDVSTQFQFEKTKLLSILPLAKPQNHNNLIILYQPTELQLVKIYRILPIDIFVTAIPCRNKYQTPRTKEQANLPQPNQSQSESLQLTPSYPSAASRSDSPETRNQYHQERNIHLISKKEI